MAVDKLVDSSQLDADLTSVANAIRTKGGTSASLAFPAGFVSAIGDIPSSGGGFSVDDIANGDITGDVVLTATKIPAFRFAQQKIHSVSSVSNFTCPTVRNGSGGSLSGRQFLDCTSLVSVSFPNATGSADGMFYGCTALATLDYKKLQTLNGSLLFGCASLATAVFPNIISGDGVYSSVFQGCTSLATVDLDGTTLGFRRTNTFKSCSALKTLILRPSFVVPLSNVNNFDGTPFASGGTGGTIYIPKSLYDHLGDGTSSDYQAATNWATLHGYGTITWAKIEGSIYETQYADGTTIPTS